MIWARVYLAGLAHTYTMLQLLHHHMYDQSVQTMTYWHGPEPDWNQKAELSLQCFQELKQSHLKKCRDNLFSDKPSEVELGPLEPSNVQNCNRTEDDGTTLANQAPCLQSGCCKELAHLLLACPLSLGDSAVAAFLALQDATQWSCVARAKVLQGNDWHGKMKGSQLFSVQRGDGDAKDALGAGSLMVVYGQGPDNLGGMHRVLDLMVECFLLSAEISASKDGTIKIIALMTSRYYRTTHAVDGRHWAL